MEELLIALCDAIKAHWSLYLKGGISHRDISENNIIITDSTKAKGFAGSERTGARNQTDKMEFIAIEVLRDVAHIYRQGLESILDLRSSRLGNRILVLSG